MSIEVQQYRALARSDAGMNAQLRDPAARIDAADGTRDLGAFLGSVLGTLGRVLWADRIWLWWRTKDPEVMVFPWKEHP